MHAQDKCWCFLRGDRITELPTCFFRPSLALQTLNLGWGHDLHPILGSKSSLQALQPDTDLGPILSSWQSQKVASTQGKAGPPCGSALALSTPRQGQGGWAKLWKAKQGGVRDKGQSCSLDGQAAVAEELADDRWVSHSRYVSQVMVILSNLPKHPPHDFP